MPFENLRCTAAAPMPAAVHRPGQDVKAEQSRLEGITDRESEIRALITQGKSHSEGARLTTARTA